MEKTSIFSPTFTWFFGQVLQLHGGFPDSSVGKGSACNAVDPGSIPGLGRSPGEGIGYLLQYSWASLVVQLVICLQCWRPGFNLWVGKIPWRKERLPTPVFWPAEFHGLYRPWGHKESDRTDQLSLSLSWCVKDYTYNNKPPEDTVYSIILSQYLLHTKPCAGYKKVESTQYAFSEFTV